MIEWEDKIKMVYKAFSSQNRESITGVQILEMWCTKWCAATGGNMCIKSLALSLFLSFIAKRFNSNAIEILFAKHSKDRTKSNIGK